MFDVIVFPRNREALQQIAEYIEQFHLGQWFPSTLTRTYMKHVNKCELSDDIDQYVHLNLIVTCIMNAHTLSTHTLDLYIWH